MKVRAHGGPKYTCSQPPTEEIRWPDSEQGESMKRCIVGLGLLALLGGCVSNQPGSYMSQANNPGGGQQGHCGAHSAQCVPNMMGPRGEPVAVRVPATALEPESGEAMARNVL